MKELSLNERMKENYENRSKTYLTRRTPVIIRLDGKAFHTFTKCFKKPYDEIFHNAMNYTMMKLCENIQGCKFGYTQSDEISLLLTDYDTLTTDAWFDYSVQKMCSIAASMATLYFNKGLNVYLALFYESIYDTSSEDWKTDDEKEIQYFIDVDNQIEKGAVFDCRCFNIPEDEITNYFIARQQDATRNAIQMLGQCHFSQKMLNKKSTNDIQNMLMLDKGINFNDMPVEFKRGVCCVKKEIQNPNIDIKDGYCPKKVWCIDKDIPIFTKNREYIEDVFKN
jgi:tRNA(His) 5'-end guanylyltransferase